MREPLVLELLRTEMSVFPGELRRWGGERGGCEQQGAKHPERREWDGTKIWFLQLS